MTENKKKTKSEKIGLIVDYLKKNPRAPIKEIADKTGLSINTVNNHIPFIKSNYIFAVIEKNSTIEEYLELHGIIDTRKESNI